MFDFRGSDPEGERPESAVRRGVAVAADDRHPGLRTSLLGSDDMDDAAARIAHREILDPETTRVLNQRLELRARLAIGHPGGARRADEHTAELQSTIRTSYAVLRFKKTKITRISQVLISN